MELHTIKPLSGLIATAHIESSSPRRTWVGLWIFVLRSPAALFCRSRGPKDKPFSTAPAEKAADPAVHSRQPPSKPSDSFRTLASNIAPSPPAVFDTTRGSSHTPPSDIRDQECLTGQNPGTPHPSRHTSTAS